MVSILLQGHAKRFYVSQKCSVVLSGLYNCEKFYEELFDLFWILLKLFLQYLLLIAYDDSERCEADFSVHAPVKRIKMRLMGELIITKLAAFS